MNSNSVFRLDLDLRDSVWRRLFPDALVLEEDRFLKLASLPEVDLDPRDDLDAAYIMIRRERPLPLGRFLALGPGPGREGWVYQAVVHNLSASPTCREGDVRRALVAIVGNAANRGFDFLACESLGFHGGAGLSIEEVMSAVDAAVTEICLESSTPMRIVVLFNSLDEVEQASNAVRSLVLRRANRRFRNVDGGSALVEVMHNGRRLHYRFVPGSLSGYLVTRFRAGSYVAGRGGGSDDSQDSRNQSSKTSSDEQSPSTLDE